MASGAAAAGGTRAPLEAFASKRKQGSKGGMLRDIWETPQVLQRLLEAHIQGGAAFAPPDRAPSAPPTPTGGSRGGKSVRMPSLEQPLPNAHGLAGRKPLEVMAACSRRAANRFTIIGSGTSYHAALVAEYLIEHIARIPVVVELSSEYRFRTPVMRSGDVLIVVSSSGETGESVESLRVVRNAEFGNDVLVIGVVNDEESTIARESDAFLSVMAGDEVGVASTKVLSSTIAAFTLLAVALGDACGNLSDLERRRILQELQAVPSQIQTILERESRALKGDDGEEERALQIGDCRLWDISCQNVLANNFIYLGRGFNFPIALEGAMKCKEIAYVHAEGYPAAEMKHGPIALIDQFMPVVVIAPKADSCYEKIKSNIEEVNARSGATIAITEDDNTELEAICEYVVYVPRTHEFLMPLLTVVPMQLLSYMMGTLRGNEVDNPPALRKVISLDVPALSASLS